jgi:hypothetical protein
MTFTTDSMNDLRVEVDRLGRARSRVPARRGARLAVAVVIATLAALAAACAHSAKNPAGDGSASSGSSSGVMAKALAYSRCMRSHGISDFPDPSGSGGGFSFNLHGGPNSDLHHNNPQYQAANQACQRLLPGGSTTPHQSPQKIAEEARLATCMRSHGFPSFPDPNSQGAFDLSGIDRTLPAFQSALQTCETASGFSGPLPVAESDSGQ